MRRPTDALPELCPEDWAAATDHRFCAELARGTLPEARMRWYLVEDHKFIGAFVRLLAAAIAEAPTLEDAVPSAQFLAIITGPENTYFLRSLEALGVGEDARAGQPAPEGAALIEMMEAARRSGCYADMLAVLVAAEWSYLEWGERHAPPAPGLPFWCAEWIELHSGPGFRAVVDHLRGQLDRAGERLDAAGRARVGEIFARTIALEVAFFDAAMGARG